jgi:predicted tellurium resistance membrane protein TerC
MISWIYDPEAWIALATLTSLEIVLGIDNIVVISILVGRLPKHQRHRGRIIGLALAMCTRLALLLTLAWMMRLIDPLFTIMGEEISGRDLIMLSGGLFLIGKSTLEIHNTFEAQQQPEGIGKVSSFVGVLIQIALVDIIFSLDSVITAVGMANHIPVMVLAIIIAVLIMMLAAKSIGDFVDTHPTVKMLALSFLVLIGMALIGEGADQHIPKGYIYFAMAFSVCVEMLNIRLRKHI